MDRFPSDPSFFMPTGLSVEEASRQVTHLGIGAHQDDLEIMALPGILACYEKIEHHFGGIVCTHGGGSPRSGRYAACTDEEMKIIRHEEQKEAALLGKYLFLAQLPYSSASILDRSQTPLVEALTSLLLGMHPEVIYTHHLLDKHPTHRAVADAVVAAIRKLPQACRPKLLLGGEVWRGLDWLTDADKIVLDVSAHPTLAEKLITVFESQVAGGKRYDLATLGRHQANATYAAPHQVDSAALVSYAVDLTPLIEGREMDHATYMRGFVERFQKEIEDGL